MASVHLCSNSHDNTKIFSWHINVQQHDLPCVRVQEGSHLREQVAGHEHLQEQLSKTKAELELCCKDKDRQAAACKKKDEDHQIQLATMRDAADAAEAEKTALSEQLQAAQTELQNVADQVQRAKERGTEKEAELQAEISKLKEQNQVLTEEKEQCNITEANKLKADHEAEVCRLQTIQLRLEKEVRSIANLACFQSRLFSLVQRPVLAGCCMAAQNRDSLTNTTRCS